MKQLDLVLQRQRQEIEELKKCKINVFKGFGKNILLSFGGLFQYPNGEQGASSTQNRINEGFYKSLEDFDSYHTADIEFTDYYKGQELEKYREETKLQLIELAKAWRVRVKKEYPKADISIIVHQLDGDWFLDTFNYSVDIENAIYL